MTKDVIAAFSTAAKQAPRLYFAPIVGAIKAVRAELRRMDSKPKQPAQAAKK